MIYEHTVLEIFQETIVAKGNPKVYFCQFLFLNSRCSLGKKIAKKKSVPVNSRESKTLKKKIRNC